MAHGTQAGATIDEVFDIVFSADLVDDGDNVTLDGLQSLKRVLRIG